MLSCSPALISMCFQVVVILIICVVSLLFLYMLFLLCLDPLMSRRPKYLEQQNEEVNLVTKETLHAWHAS